MSEPAVSVVMAMFNEARFAVEAAESVLRQTFTDLELIVVDDGSTDGGAELIEALPDTRIRLLRQSNAGLAAALNAGIGLARAPWVARHDADDVSVADRLRVQMERVDRAPALVLLGTNAIQMDEEGRAIAATEFPDDDAALRALLLRMENPFVHGSVLFRRQAVIEAGLYRPQFRQAQDFDLWLRLMDYGQLGNVREPLYRWRLRRGGIGASKAEDQRDHARLALLAARRRAAGLPEPRLDIAVVRRHGVIRFFTAFRGAHGDAAYDLGLAKLLIRAGERQRARRHAAAVIRKHPLNAYAWLLAGLTMLPARPAHTLWTWAIRAYRTLIWKKQRHGASPDARE